MTLVAVALGLWVNSAERQRRAVAAIRAAGGSVVYDWEAQEWHSTDLPGPDWLCRQLGVDYFDDVAAAGLSSDAGDSDVAHLSQLTDVSFVVLQDTKVSDSSLAHLTRLTSLKVLWLDRSQVTDAGLAHLTGLKRLESLTLERTQVTDAGCERLQQALPNCKIER
jgi:hypothetical protein